MLQIKIIPKNISTSTSWTFSFIYFYKLSEETTQRKHTRARYVSFAKNKQILRPNNNFTSR